MKAEECEHHIKFTNVYNLMTAVFIIHGSFATVLLMKQSCGILLNACFSNVSILKGVLLWIISCNVTWGELVSPVSSTFCCPSCCHTRSPRLALWPRVISLCAAASFHTLTTTNRKIGTIKQSKYWELVMNYCVTIIYDDIFVKKKKKKTVNCSFKTEFVHELKIWKQVMLG